MARTVSFTQHGEPEWLALGKRWQKLASEMDAVQAAAHLGLSPGEVRTARRFARAAEFLTATYPVHATGPVPVLAGSVAVLELARLHSLDSKLADGMAAAVLQGDLNTAQVRAHVAAAVEQNESVRRKASRSGSLWLASFRQLAIERLTTERLLRPLGRVGKINWADRRATLDPDLVATFVGPFVEMAIAVRAPRDATAKSSATVAAGLLSQVATLLLRYDAAMLVLPIQAAGAADATLDLWHRWLKPERLQSCKMYILLLDEDEHRLLSPNDPESTPS
jgi:hypothetical protein